MTGMFERFRQAADPEKQRLWQSKEGDYVEAQESAEGEDGMDNQANDTQEA